MGHPKYGLFSPQDSLVLFAGLLINWICDPTRALLKRLDETEYASERPRWRTATV